MKITEGQLRRIIRQEVQALREAQGADDDDPVKSFLNDARRALDDNRSREAPEVRIDDLISKYRGEGHTVDREAVQAWLNNHARVLKYL